MKNEQTKRIDAIVERVTRSRSSLLEADYASLTGSIAMLRSTLQTATDERVVREASAGISELESQLQAALEKKKRLDAQSQLRDAELQEFLLDQIREKLQRAQGQGSEGLDPAGYTSAQQAIEAAAAAISSRTKGMEELVGRAEQAVDAHLSGITTRLAEVENARAAAEEAVGELEAIIEGLQADEVVMRWQSDNVDELGWQLSAARQAVAEGRFGEPDSILADAREASASAVNNANHYQLHADERDYIARSIASSLSEMGFHMAAPSPEYPGRADSSIILSGENDSGEGVAVSVPIEGQVLYDVAGYPIETTERIDGSGPATTCDKAEGMLLEMQKALREHFGVVAGEIGWDTKDPDRRLRAADELPRDQDSSRERGDR